MSIYSKNGDRGTTDLVRSHNISKSDDRIGLAGEIEELNSHIGLCRSMISDPDTVRFLEKIQKTLLTVSSGVRDPYNNDFRLKTDSTELLEEEISRLEDILKSPDQDALPGRNLLSAELHVTRSVARRAERTLASVSVKFGADNGAKKYMNRLSDYFYMLAKYFESADAGTIPGVSTPGSSYSVTAAAGSIADCSYSEAVSGVSLSSSCSGMSSDAEAVPEAVIQEVLKRMGVGMKMTLSTAKRLIEEIEKEAQRRGKNAVIAVCSPDGSPVAVHVMDGAFLVSFEAAVRKAYTAAALKMSTAELAVLASPGGTFYGIESLENGKITIIGGGIPLKSGNQIIGSLGISGGTAEEDHSLAEYGATILQNI
ncbi:MAG: cob(I)yrinic acid a,c-diamide adenosyltransferase [Blautia sp.]|nr:cob(I)yrinic acid a,c-diamide adenosyltransferase [Blautia sp.]